MPHEFEITEQITVGATPDQVWAAIATGPGVDSWFMGRTDFEPRPGGTRTLDITDAVGVVQRSTISTWEPGARLAFREDSADGTFSAVEYLLEARGGGSTTLRYAHHGILDGDDWEAQYDGLSAGDRMYLAQLACYLRHFPGRQATRNLFLIGPVVTDNQRAWAHFAAALSMTGEITPGAPVRLNVPGLPAADGVVEFVGLPHFVGVRTGDGMHLFVRGYRDAIAVGYHGFTDDVDAADIDTVWRAWLASAAATTT